MRRLGFHYSWRAFVGDLSGGMIAALIALPYGLALASMMGLPPILGLVTSIVTAPVTVLLGRNPVLIGGTASATVPFIAAAVRKEGMGGAAKVCIGASVFLLAFSVLRLGRYIQRVPQPVVTGFSCGIGGTIDTEGAGASARHHCFHRRGRCFRSPSEGSGPSLASDPSICRICMAANRRTERRTVRLRLSFCIRRKHPDHIARR